VYEILKGGGFTTGGFNFDAKLRRQSIARTDLFHAHIGGIDALARSLLVAADMLERRTLQDAVDARYAAWDGELGREILDGSVSLEELERRVADGIEPVPVSGGQERLEGLVNRHIWQADRAR
jgi:xylose isomerase